MAGQPNRDDVKRGRACRLALALLCGTMLSATQGLPALAGAGGAGGGGGVGGADSPTGAGTNGGIPGFPFGGGGGGGAGQTGGNGGTGGGGGSGGAGGAAAGQSGADGLTFDTGGGGGGGAHGYVDAGAGLPTGTPAVGGNGGRGADGSGVGGDGGGGGAGGWGAVVTTPGSLGTLSVDVTGGNGGQGGNNSLFNAGSGGSGGTGLYIETVGGVTLGIAADVTGGNGGNAGTAPTNGAGGAGGAGLIVIGGGTLQVNAGVTGGNGGTGGGAGGAGIVGNNLNITIGAGPGVSVTGGNANGGGGAQADAITFTGGTNTLSFGGATSNLSGNIGVNGAGTTLTFDQSGINTTVDNIIAGSGSVIKTGNATITLSGTNSYTGTTTINAGTLEVQGGSAIADTGQVSIANVAGATLLVTDSETIGSLSGGGSTGGAVSIATGQTLTTGDNTGDNTFAGIISGGGGLTKRGTDTFILSGTNAYGGGTTISAGTVSISADANLGAAGTTVTLNNGTIVGGAGTGADAVLQTTSTFSSTRGIAFTSGGGRIETDTGTTLTLSGAITTGGSASFIKQGAGTLVLTGDSSAGYNGRTWVNEGTLRIEAGGKLGSNGAGGQAYISNGATAIVTGPGSSWETFGQMRVGEIGSGTLQIEAGGSVKTGSGAGTVGIVGGGGDSSVTITGSGSQWVGNGTEVYIGHTYAGTLTLSDGGTFVLTGASSTLQAGLVGGSAGGIVNIGAAEGSAAAAAGDLIVDTVSLNTSASQVVFNHTDAGYMFASDITGDGSVRQIAGTTILTGNNTFTGDTVVDGGTLSAATDTALSADSAVSVNMGATLEIADLVYADIASLSDGALGGGSVVIGTTQSDTILFVGANGGATTSFSGQITGAGSLELWGGDLTLTGQSTIGGQLLVDFGTTLAVSGPGASFTVNDPVGGVGLTTVLGELTVDGGASLATDNLFVGGTMVVDGIGTTATSSDITFVGIADPASLTISGGAVMDSLNGAAVESPTMAATAIVTGAGSTWNITGPLLVGGFIGGTGQVTVSASGVINVSGETVIAADVTSTGLDQSTMLITGPGSALNTDTLQIGDAGCGCIGDQPGMLTVTDGGLVTVTSGVNIAPQGTLLIGTGGGLAAPAIVNDGAIIVDIDNDATVAADVSGTGTFTKDGTGKLTLTGTASYTGATFVDGGILSVNGDIASSSLLTIASGGTLGGNGTVGTTLVNGGGTLAPGNSIGTLSVSGDLTLAAGSTYAVEVDASSADRTDVSGTADLSGGTVATDYGTATYVQKSYTIVNAQGGLGGTHFAGLTGTAPTGFTQKLTYDDANAYLVLDLAIRPPEPEPEPEPGPGPEPGPEPGPTPEPGPEPGPEPSPEPTPGLSYDAFNLNQRAVADAIIGYFDANGGIPIAFGELDATGLSQASGEPTAGAISAGIRSADLFLDLISDQALAGRGVAGASGAAGPAASAYADEDTDTGRQFTALGMEARHAADPVARAFESRWQGWGAAYGGSADIDGDPVQGSHDTSADTFGLAGGISRRWEGTVVGLALGGGTSSFDLSDGLGEGHANTFNAGLFARQEFGDAYIAAAGAYGFHAVDIDRAVLGEGLEGKFDAHSFSGRVEAGYGIATPIATLTPYAAFQAIAYRLPDYTETGAGSFALSYEGETTTVTRTELGARLDHLIGLDSGATLTLSGRAALAINAGDDIGFTAGFVDLPGTSFTITGATPDRYSALVDAGAEYRIGNGFFAALAFQGEFSGNTTSLAGKARIGFNW